MCYHPSPLRALCVVCGDDLLSENRYTPRKSGNVMGILFRLIYGGDSIFAVLISAVTCSKYFALNWTTTRTRARARRVAHVCSTTAVCSNSNRRLNINPPPPPPTPPSTPLHQNPAPSAVCTVSPLCYMFRQFLPYKANRIRRALCRK